MGQSLSSAERTVLETIARWDIPRYVRRARVLLRWDEELAAPAIAQQSGLSARRVRYWLRRFLQQRLGVFPVKVLNRAAPSLAGDQGGVAEAPGQEGTPAEPAAPQKQELPKAPGVLPDDPMSEAGRKVLGFHFQRMLAHEAGTRIGENIEELHDMRVATRRMRAAFRVFGEHFEPKAVRPFKKGLRRTARLLGAVRDLDVLLEKAGRYLESLPEAERSCLDPLLSAWRGQRQAARDELLSHLDSEAYRGFCQRFAGFLQTEGAGSLKSQGEEPAANLVRHVAPCEIYERLAEVRAFGPYLDAAPVTTLHALRIHCKHLRYALEFFEEVLGPEAKGAIKQVVALQDHLGALQDAVVATDLLRGFLNEWAERQKTERVTQRIDIHGVTQYLAAKQVEIYDLLESFPAAWADLESPRFRQALAMAVAVL